MGPPQRRLHQSCGALLSSRVASLVRRQTPRSMPRLLTSAMVRTAGLEPARSYELEILSLVCLPIPPRPRRLSCLRFHPLGCKATARPTLCQRPGCRRSVGHTLLRVLERSSADITGAMAAPIRSDFQAPMTLHHTDCLGKESHGSQSATHTEHAGVQSDPKRRRQAVAKRAGKWSGRTSASAMSRARVSKGSIWLSRLIIRRRSISRWDRRRSTRS